MTHKRKRRRNPDDARRARLWLTAIAGIAAGGAVGYLVASSRAAHRFAEQTGLDKWRLPDASYKPHLPYSSDDFALLDDIVCECVESERMVVNDGDVIEIDQIVDRIRLCVAREVHPDFEWPPVMGDHPNATQLWSELGVLIRRALLDGRCDRTIPPVPVPPSTPGGFT